MTHRAIELLDQSINHFQSYYEKLMVELDSRNPISDIKTDHNKKHFPRFNTLDEIKKHKKLENEETKK